MGDIEKSARVYPERKQRYFEKVAELLASYNNIILAGVDMVGSNQLQKIRKSLRKRAVVVLGKNTMIRRVIRSFLLKNPESKLQRLLSLKDGAWQYLTGNFAMIFTNEDPKSIRDIAVAERVPAVARAGNIAPVDVHIPAGPTGMDPGQTGFFQALNIATKIVKGSVEIINPVHLIKKGDKVGNSEVTLLDKLNIKPFSYGLVVLNVYEDGAIYGAEILDITQQEMFGKFWAGVNKLKALSVSIHYPTVASVPYLLANAASKAVAIALVTDISFELAQKYKDYLANPNAFAAAAPAAAAGGASSSAGKAAAPEPAKPTKKEESEESEGGGMNLFGDD